MPKPTKKQMIEFLTGHFRYDTMNSWNRATSYAARVKIRDFVPRTLWDISFDLLGMDEVYEDIGFEFQEFAHKYNYAYQVGFNGRSSGYIVLYTGGRHEDGKPFSYPGRGLDMDEDFHDWSCEDVRVRYDVVKDFDALVDTCKEIFLRYCRDYKVVDRTITVTKKIKALEPVGAE